MKQDRRGFLKLFGVTSAAIAAAPCVVDAEPSIEIIKADKPAELLTPPFRSLYPICEHMHVRDEPLWSQLRVERNAMKECYQLFQKPLGSDFTLAETNMHIPGSLIPPEMYCIKQIGFVFSPKTIAGLRSAFIERYTLELYFGRKRYWHAPLSMVFSIDEPDREKGFATLPATGFMDLEIPLVIEAGMYFCLEVIGEPIHPCGTITGWGVFKGLHAVGIL